MPNVIEIAVLLMGAGVLLFARATARQWKTISELYWTLRDNLTPRSRWGLNALLAGALWWLWVHLVAGGRKGSALTDLQAPR